MPFIVGVSLLGALSIHIMMSSRICFSGALVGHMPELFAHINMKCFSPIPALSFLVRFVNSLLHEMNIIHGRSDMILWQTTMKKNLKRIST